MVSPLAALVAVVRAPERIHRPVPAKRASCVGAVVAVESARGILRRCAAVVASSVRGSSWAAVGERGRRQTADAVGRRARGGSGRPTDVPRRSHAALPWRPS